MSLSREFLMREKEKHYKNVVYMRDKREKILSIDVS